MTQAISSANLSGFADELAVLMLENETNQKDSARLQRDAARQSYLDQAEQQVAALHAAADAMATGALVSGALTIASGACQIGAATYQYQADVSSSAAEGAENKEMASLFADAASTTGKLAQPAGVYFGDTPAGHLQAEAKRHEMLATQAQWQAGDASSDIDTAEKHADKMLDLVETIQRDQNTATNALINRI